MTEKILMFLALEDVAMQIVFELFQANNGKFAGETLSEYFVFFTIRNVSNNLEKMH